ncbi:Ion channel [Photobacterium aquimaris]|uniref:Ion channel n=2 Tax=Photobacterium aquimaris TaxID=512643 RepID=A0A1Y6KYG6_9GAMM|nr:two pore domain potassium channel family protein [Photobacterium aquimaris]PST98356.1 hypothetical protein C0W81_18160 [Photobacterium aquimaris]SMY15418.1 Ion channel [Photobacterium aquimaris]
MLCLTSFLYLKAVWNEEKENTFGIERLFKLITPIIICRCNLEDSTFAIILISYLLLETLLYLLDVIFLSDIYSPPISRKRSYLMLVINYIEVCLGFAVLYKATGGVSELVSNFAAIYFSFITATTIGYGHMALTE